MGFPGSYTADEGVSLKSTLCERLGKIRSNLFSIITDITCTWLISMPMATVGHGSKCSKPPQVKLVAGHHVNYMSTLGTPRDIHSSESVALAQNWISSCLRFCFALGISYDLLYWVDQGDGGGGLRRRGRHDWMLTVPEHMCSFLPHNHQLRLLAPT